MAHQVPPEVLDYLGSQKTLTLATSGSDGPWAATLTYVNDGPTIYVWTRPNSTTARHIDENPTTAFAIDEYTEDWRQTKGIQGRAGSAVVQGEEIARAADLFGQKYPQLRPGSTSAIVFFRLEPDSLEFIDNSRGVEESDEFGADYRRQSVLDMPAIEE
ncbi:MAG: pyridoxamine 5'-phosphate oxidase family protein [Thermoleophilaceae bacterium]